MIGTIDRAETEMSHRKELLIYGVGILAPIAAVYFSIHPAYRSPIFALLLVFCSINVCHFFLRKTMFAGAFRLPFCETQHDDERVKARLVCVLIYSITLFIGAIGLYWPK